MTSPAPRRRLVFFVVALLLPSAMLLGFGVVLIRQDMELEVRRARESRMLVARQWSDSLFRALETAYAEAEPGPGRHFAGSPLLDLGRIEAGAVRLSGGPPSESPLLRRDVQDFIVRTTAMERAGRRPLAAARAFEGRARGASSAVEQAFLRQRAAVAYRAANRTDRAIELALRVVAEPDSVVDEFGTPIALYAAGMLIAESRRKTVAQRLAAPPQGWLTPAALELWTMLASVDSAVANDHALIASLGRRPLRMDPAPGSPRWVVDESGRWLVRLADGDRLEPERLTAVPIDRLGEFLPPSAPIRIAASDSVADAMTLSPTFPSLAAVVRVETENQPLRRIVPTAGVLLFLIVALLAGYLLWRDVRRETRIAALRSQFVSSVSHELRTPLTSIRLYAETMRASPDDPPEERARDLTVIASESERLTRMLDNVLTTSRIERGSMRYRLALDDLGEPVARAARSMAYAFGQAGVPFSTTIDSVFTFIDTDAAEQAVINLLSNALKYGDRTPVELRCIAVDAEARVEVVDKGPGLPDGTAERIFDRFHREEEAVRRGIPGAGLGLSLVRHTMDAHGGSVTVTSSASEGTTFTLHFPIRVS